MEESEIGQKAVRPECVTQQQHSFSSAAVLVVLRASVVKRPLLILISKHN